MSVVLLTSDLMTSSRIEAIAGHLGMQCKTAISVAVLDDCLIEGTRLVVLDLSMPELVPSTIVPKIRTSLAARPQIVAFGPHVHGELLEEAETSGCDVVVSRGEFFARLPEMLSRGLSPST
jgi:hypothetical protein